MKSSFSFFSSDLFKSVNQHFFSIFLNKFLKYNMFFKSRGTKSVCKSGAVFRTQPRIYDGVFPLK